MFPIPTLRNKILVLAKFRPKNFGLKSVEDFFDRERMLEGPKRSFVVLVVVLVGVVETGVENVQNGTKNACKVL